MSLFLYICEIKLLKRKLQKKEKITTTIIIITKTALTIINYNEMEVKNSSGNGDKPLISKQNQIRIKTEILQKTALPRTARVIRTIYIILTGSFDHYNLTTLSVYIDIRSVLIIAK